MADSSVYGFTVEWFDRQAEMIKEYILNAFVPQTGCVEVAMYEQKTNRRFLKRVEVPSLSPQDFRIGANVTIYGRQLKVTGYCDERTRTELEALHSGVCFVTAPQVFRQFGALLGRLEGAGLRVARLRLVNEGGPSFAVQLTGEDAEMAWADVTRSVGEGNARRVSDGELSAYFDRATFPGAPTAEHCSLVLVRPHAVREGAVGTVLGALAEAGVEVGAVELLSLNKAQAAEMFDVYKGVLPFYSDLIHCMTSGHSVAIDARGGPEVCGQLRELCGPFDVEVARHLRPGCLRAQIGRDNANNGVHVTDLPEDGPLEVSYIFKSLLGQ